MTGEEYKEKLKDTRWLRKRERILRRDGYTCKECGNSHAVLNVHHLFYIHGLEPWEYKDANLTTLCEQCHEMLHLRKKANAIAPKETVEDMAETAPTKNITPWKGSWKTNRPAPRVTDAPKREDFCRNIAAAMPEDIKARFTELVNAKTVGEVHTHRPRRVPFNALAGCPVTIIDGGEGE